MATLAVIIFLSVCLERGIQSAGVCTSEKNMGYKDQSKLINSLDDSTGFGVLSRDMKLRLDCCGTIKFWRFHAINTGTVHMQVWRPGEKNERYQLVDQNVLRVSEYNTTVTVSVPRPTRIAVKSGDHIGWYSPGKAIIPYGKIGSKYYHLLLKNLTTDIASTVDWSAAQKRHDRSYAIETIIESNSKPIFYGTRTINVPEDTPIGGHAFKVNVRDDDPQDVNQLSVSLEEPSDYFEIKDATMQVVVKNTPPRGNYTLQMKVTDRCQSRTIGEFQIFVQNLPKEETGISHVEEYGWVIGVSVVVFVLIALVVTMAILQYLGILRKIFTKRTTDQEM